MRLDNRTQALLVSGEAFSDASAKDQIKTYFAATGGTVEEVPEGVKITYSNRAAAEKVCLSIRDPGGKADRIGVGSRNERDSGLRWQSQCDVVSTFGLLPFER